MPNLSSLSLRAKAHRALRQVKTQDFCELEEIIERGKQAKVIYDYMFSTSISQIELK